MNSWTKLAPLLFATVEAGDTLFNPTCPSVTVDPVFLPAIYTGLWYEIQRDGSTSFEWMADCTTAKYTAQSDGTIEVRNRAWYWYYFFSYYEVKG